MVMYGEQYHHNHPSVLLDNFYLCAARAINSRVMLDLGITCVINATLEMPTFAYQKQESMQIAVEDRVGSKLYVYFDVVADKINSVLTSGGCMMIYCRAGMSRSAALCIAYFIKYHQMNLEEAYQFVRARRPIIMPNKGFMNQLRHYEERLKFRRSGLKRKFEQDEISFADEEELEFDEGIFDTIEDLEVIKPRPKPRISKPKPLDPELTAGVLHVAEVLEVIQVQLCIDEKSRPKTPLPIPSKPPSRSKSQRRPRGQSLKSRPVSMPARPATPLPGTSVSVNCVYHSPLTVAENAENAPIFEAAGACASSHSRTASMKKRPFTKISAEPSRIAVSFTTIPWGLASQFEKRASFMTEQAHYSVFTDVPHAVAAKYQEVAFECAGHPRTPITATTTTRTTTATTTTTLSTVRPVTVVTSLRKGPASSFTPVIYDCAGLYKRENVDAILPPRLTQPPQPQAQAVPSRFSGLSRSSATRASIKLPGLRIASVPETHRKRPVPNLDLNFRLVANVCQSPVVFEKAESFVKTFRPAVAFPKNVIYSPKREALTETITTTYEKSIKDPTLSFKLAIQLTVPRRTVILRSPGVTVEQPEILCEAEDMPPEKSIMPAKEYPYYSPVRKISNILEMGHATKEPAVEVSWLSTTAKADKASSLIVPKITKVKIKPQDFEPELHWAAERCQFDPTSIRLETRPMEDLPEVCRARTTWQKSALASQIKIMDQTNLCDTTQILPKKKMPERYNPWIITRMCIFPLYQAGISYINEPCFMQNLYCEPTPFKAWAKPSVHKTDPSKPEVPNNQDYLCVAITNAPNVVIDNAVELVDIPDVMADLNQIQPLLAQQKDPAKLVIWLEVFKRSVIKARPIRPFVRVTGLLPVAECREVKLIGDCSNFNKVSTTIPTVRALYTTVTEASLKAAQATVANLKGPKAELQHAVQVEECFMADVIHTYNPVALRIRAIAQREKAVECTEYIRNYTMGVWSEPINDQEAEVWDKAPNLKRQMVKPVKSIASFRQVANIETTEICGDADPIDEASMTKWLARRPFSKLTGCLQHADVSFTDCLMAPEVELKPFSDRYYLNRQQAMIYLQENTKTEQKHLVKSGPVDTFWYFQVDSPKLERKKTASIVDLTQLGATASIASSTGSTFTLPTSDLPSEPVPIAAPGTFQLFLPDPEMMDRVGEAAPEEVFKATASMDSSKSNPGNVTVIAQTSGSGVTHLTPVPTTLHPLRPVSPIPTLPPLISVPPTDNITTFTSSGSPVGIPEIIPEEALNDGEDSDESDENDSSSLDLAMGINTATSTPEPILKPDDLVQGSVKARAKVTRTKSDRRVIIADPPVSGSQSPPRLPKLEGGKPTTRIVSYQRPKVLQQQRSTSRSRSRNRKEDKKAMDDLNASLRQASDLLDRRRTAGVSSYNRYESSSSSSSASTSGSRPTSERGRTSTRYYSSVSTYSHSVTTSTSLTSDSASSAGASGRPASTSPSSSRSNSASGAPGDRDSSSLWGLLGMAQSWIMSHKSRRDRSEDRAKNLVRRSRQL